MTLNTSVMTVQVLPGYRLQLRFSNGSRAIVNMEQRLRGDRFHPLADPALFATAQVRGDSMIWQRDGRSVRATVSEVLDSMML